MNKKYNLIEVVEMWVNKEIDTEKMKRLYADIPLVIPKTWAYSEDIDPIVYIDGSGNTDIEVKTALVRSNKMTIEEFLDWVELVEDIERPIVKQ